MDDGRWLQDFWGRPHNLRPSFGQSASRCAVLRQSSAPTIGAAIAARHLVPYGCATWSTCSDLRMLDRRPDAAITSLIPWRACRSCRPHRHLPSVRRLGDFGPSKIASRT